MFRVPYIANIDGIYEFLRSIYTRLGGSVLTKSFVVEIGDWDMSTDATKNVEYKQTLDDINYKSVLNVSVQIYNDDKTKSYFSGTDDFDSIYVDSTTKTSQKSSTGFAYSFFAVYIHSYCILEQYS